MRLLTVDSYPVAKRPVESMNYEPKRRLQELRDELRGLMDEQVESLKAQTFGEFTNYTFQFAIIDAAELRRLGSRSH